MNIHLKQIWKMKMTYFIAAVIVIAFAMIIGISQRKHPELEGDSYQFSFNAENYVYQGGKLTDQQIENLEDSMVDIVQQMICAVNESKTEIDLSAYANNEQWIKMSMQVAAAVDPMVEESNFVMDSEKEGLFYIDYGCSEEEHRKKVKEFQKNIENIVKECATGADTDVAYAKAVCEYLVNHCRYDYETFSSSRESGITKAEGAARYRQMSVYQVIMNGSGVCQQFSRAYSLLLRQVGIPVLEIGGISNIPFASNNVAYDGKKEGELFGINHMWNELQLSGEWYGADITMAVNALETEEEFSQNTMNRYFGMSDEMMQRNFPSDFSIVTIGYQTMDVPACEKELILIGEENNEDQWSESRSDDKDQSESGMIDKIDVHYEVISSDESGTGVTMVLAFEECETVYQLDVSMPENYKKDQVYQICYLLGEDASTDMADVPEDAICVRIAEISKEGTSDQNPGLFLNLFVGGMMEAVENRCSVDAENRMICGNGLGANMCLYALFQSDGLTKDTFAKYVCVDPDMYHRFNGKTLSEYEDLYFGRCRQLSTSLLVQNTSQADEGQIARLELLKNRIKKREYKNFYYI